MNYLRILYNQCGCFNKNRWHNQTPDFLFKDATKETLLQRLRDYILCVGKRYESDFYCWDVVNEAIEDKSDYFYRKSPWLDIIGEGFIEHSFRIAKEILPETDLYYNDYNECNELKRNKVYKQVKNMLDRDVPIDGVGLQCHWNIFSPKMDEFKRAMEQYAKLGLKIQITEMDISVYEFTREGKVEKPSNDMINKQAEIYKEAFSILREYKDIVDCVTLWGVADDETWLSKFTINNRKNWPLLFDENHKPKEAFYGVMDF